MTAPNTNGSCSTCCVHDRNRLQGIQAQILLREAAAERNYGLRDRVRLLSDLRVAVKRILQFLFLFFVSDLDILSQIWHR